MKRIYRSTCWAIFSFGLLTAGGCTGTPIPEDTGGSITDEGEVGATAPTGADLFKMIAQTDPYQQWAQFPDYQGTMVNALPHGPMSQVFINSVVESALDSFDGTLPDGSIIVKENIGTSSDVTEAALTVMRKVQGFDPDNNDWFWANFSPEGQIMAEGTVLGCRACHSGARSNDFVFVHPF